MLVTVGLIWRATLAAWRVVWRSDSNTTLLGITIIYCRILYKYGTLQSSLIHCNYQFNSLLSLSTPGIVLTWWREELLNEEHAISWVKLNEQLCRSSLQSASHEQIILNFPSPLQILFVIITVLECWSVVKRKMSTFNQHKIFHNMIWSLYWILSPDLTDY